MHRTFSSIQRHYRDVKGRLFVSYKSYLVLLKYTIGKTYIIAVSEVGKSTDGKL